MATSDEVRQAADQLLRGLIAKASDSGRPTTFQIAGPLGDPKFILTQDPSQREFDTFAEAQDYLKRKGFGTTLRFSKKDGVIQTQESGYWTFPGTDPNARLGRYGLPALEAFTNLEDGRYAAEKKTFHGPEGPLEFFNKDPNAPNTFSGLLVEGDNPSLVRVYDKKTRRWLTGEEIEAIREEKFGAYLDRDTAKGSKRARGIFSPRAIYNDYGPDLRGEQKYKIGLSHATDNLLDSSLEGMTILSENRMRVELDEMIRRAELEDNPLRRRALETDIKQMARMLDSMYLLDDEGNPRLHAAGANKGVQMGDMFAGFSANLRAGGFEFEAAGLNESFRAETRLIMRDPNLTVQEKLAKRSKLRAKYKLLQQGGGQIKGDVIVMRQDYYAQLAGGRYSATDMITPITNVKMEEGRLKGITKYLNMEIYPGHGGLGGEVRTDLQSLTARPWLFPHQQLLVHNEKLMKDQLESILRGDIDSDLIRALERMVADPTEEPELFARMTPAERLKYVQGNAWARQVLDMHKSGIKITDVPGGVETFISNYQKHMVHDTPKLLIPQAVRGGALSNTGGVTADILKGDPLFGNIADNTVVWNRRLERWVMNDRTWVNSKNFFGGPDLDDKLIGMFRYDEEKNRVRLIMERQPTGLGEIAEFDISHRDEQVRRFIGSYEGPNGEKYGKRYASLLAEEQMNPTYLRHYSALEKKAIEEVRRREAAVEILREQDHTLEELDQAQEIFERRRVELAQLQQEVMGEKLRIAARSQEIKDEISNIHASVFQRGDFRRLRAEQLVGNFLRENRIEEKELTAQARSLLVEGVDAEGITDDAPLSAKQAARLRQAASMLKKAKSPLGIYSNSVMIADLWKNTQHGTAAELINNEVLVRQQFGDEAAEQFLAESRRIELETIIDLTQNQTSANALVIKKISNQIVEDTLFRAALLSAAQKKARRQISGGVDPTLLKEKFFLDPERYATGGFIDPDREEVLNNAIQRLSRITGETYTRGVPGQPGQSFTELAILDPTSRNATYSKLKNDIDRMHSVLELDRAKYAQEAERLGLADKESWVRRRIDQNNQEIADSAKPSRYDDEVASLLGDVRRARIAEEAKRALVMDSFKELYPEMFKLNKLTGKLEASSELDPLLAGLPKNVEGEALVLDYLKRYAGDRKHFVPFVEALRAGAARTGEHIFFGGAFGQGEDMARMGDVLREYYAMKGGTTDPLGAMRPSLEPTLTPEDLERGAEAVRDRKRDISSLIDDLYHADPEGATSKARAAGPRVEFTPPPNESKFVSWDGLRKFAGFGEGREGSIRRGITYGVGALAALGVVHTIRNFDRTPEDMQGPPHLPGGNPYVGPMPGHSYAFPPGFNQPQESGTVYDVTVRGANTAIDAMTGNFSSLANGFGITSSKYDVPSMQNQDDPDRIMRSFG